MERKKRQEKSELEEFYSFDPKLLSLFEQAEKKCEAAFARAEENGRYNEAKVLKAFSDCRISESHFTGSTGYGYDDRGREKLDELYAQAFVAESALVRHNFVSGTHALSVALFGVLRTGDKMLCVTGSPYDTMEEVIGIRGEGNGSLRDFGISYEQLALLSDGEPDYEKITERAVAAKVVYIQRSRGYALRPSLTVSVIGRIVEAVRKGNDKAIIIVDNCYGEFVEKREPTEVGADLIVGSLIKNPGGGIAKTGGYIAGKKELVDLCAYRLTCVGMGREVGCTLGESRAMFEGFFFAPSVVTSAVKTSIFALCLFDLLGYSVTPSFDEERTDIIGAILLKSREGLIAFCKGIQQGSPVDSFVTPEPWDMPGYENQVIMAAGAFTLGASIELSADGPLREPFAVYLQGGLTYQTGKLGIMLAAKAMFSENLLSLPKDIQ